MLRHAHFDVKGGNRTFAAVSTDDRCADKADLVPSMSLGVHNLAYPAFKNSVHMECASFFPRSSMFLKLIKFAAIACVVPLLLAFSLIASQQSQDRTGESSLDFSRLPEIGGQSSPLIGYTTFDGDELGFRRFEATEDGAPLLVLVHGSGWHGLAYVQLAQRIAQAGLADVVVPDLRGPGPSLHRRCAGGALGQLETALSAQHKLSLIHS